MSYLESFIRLTLRFSIPFNVIYILAIIFGIFIAIPNLPIDRYPNIKFGEVEVITQYPGASPEEVERLVTDEIEESLRGMENIEYIRSTSTANQSLVHVKFEDDTDYDMLYNEMRFRVLSRQNLLPFVNGKTLTPVFRKLNVDEWLPVVQVNLITASRHSPLSLRTLTLLAKALRTRLELIDGVKEVILLGDRPEQYEMIIDPQKLERYQITINEVINSLQTNGRSPPGGIIDTTEGERYIKIDQRYRAPNDLYDLIIRRDGSGNPITVADVIDINESGFHPIETSIISSVNGQDTVTCKVLKTTNANAIAINEQVQEVVAEFLQTNISLHLEAVITLDSSIKIKDGLGVLINNLMLSSVLVVILLILFMTDRPPHVLVIATFLGLLTAIGIVYQPNSLICKLAFAILGIFTVYASRSAILTLSGMIISFIGTLIIFYIIGASINEMSLIGFILVCGIVVDDAIIVIDNILRLREDGLPLQEAVVKGTTEVFFPIVSATMTTCAAFSPLLLMTGSTGDFFSLIPISVITVLIVSLLESLVMLPAHTLDCERILGKENIVKATQVKHQIAKIHIPHPMVIISRFFDCALRWVLVHPRSVLALILVSTLLAISILIAPYITSIKPIIKMVFFPEDTSVMLTYIRMPVGTPLHETDRKVRLISNYLIAKGHEKVKNATGTAGMTIDSTYNPIFSNQLGLIFVELPERDQRAYDDPKIFIQEIRDELDSHFERDGIEIEVIAAPDGPPIGQPVNIRVTGITDEIVLRLTMDLLEYLKSIAKIGEKLDGIIDLQHNRDRTNTVLNFKIDTRRAALHNLSVDSAQNFIATAFNGSYIGEFRRNDKDFPIRVRFSRSLLKEPNTILNIPITKTDTGGFTRLADLGSISQHEESANLVRRDFQRTITITGNIREKASIGAPDVSHLVTQWYKEHASQYPGASIAFGGEAESTLKSYRSLGLAFIISMIFIYLILSTQFNSYTQPFLIMSNIIFCIIGVVLMMAIVSLSAKLLPPGSVRIERSYFTVQSFVALIGLSGMVVNDGIVLITFINKHRKNGLPLGDALLLAGHQRIRPIILTSLTTIAGLLCMAIGVPEFSVTWSPFASCFIAGLIMSTIMTLLVVPVLYQILEMIKEQFKNKMYSGEKNLSTS